MATADKRAKVLLCLSSFEKCHSDEAALETRLMERGKPHEQVTQTMVGALHAGNELSMGAGFMPGDR